MTPEERAAHVDATNEYGDMFESAQLALISVRRYNSVLPRAVARGHWGAVDLSEVERTLREATCSVYPRLYNGPALAEWREASDALAALDRDVAVRGCKHVIEWAELYNNDNKDMAELQASTVCDGLEFAEPEWLAWCLQLHAFDFLSDGSESLADFAKKVADIGARHETLEAAGEEFLAMLMAACPNGFSGDGPVAEGESNGNA